jgi:hypothetical protein
MKTATINISKDKHGGTVRGAVNGQRFDLEVGKDIPVTEQVLASLDQSHVDYRLVSPLAGEDAGEGSPASSTVESTAIRLETPTDGEGANDPDAEPVELQQRTDRELTEESQEASRQNAETGTFDHDGDGQPGGSEPKDPPALSGKTTEELNTIAKDEGVDLSEAKTNKDRRELIEKARAKAA